MENKICIKCNVFKKISEFKFVKKTNKFINTCKSCESEYNKKYREINKDRIKILKDGWYIENKERIKTKQKIERENNPEKYKLKNQEKYIKNKDSIRISQTKYYLNNIEEIKRYKQAWQKENSERLRVKSKNYRDQNKIDLNRKQYLRKKERLKTDPMFKFKANIRSLIFNGFYRFGFKKQSNSFNILGCSFDYFKSYIESKFEPWMNWENRGLYNGTENYGWDLDHIIPISTAKTEEDIIRLNHYTNLQPLCSYTNRVIKKDRLKF